MQNHPDKLPPHSDDAERGALACLLLAPENAAAMLAKLHRSDFYDLRHQTLFTTITRMVRSGLTPDTVTVMQTLKDKGELENVGGQPYLVELPDATPSAANLDYYLPILKDKAKRRELLALIAMAQQTAYNESLDPVEMSREFTTLSERIAARDVAPSDLEAEWLAHLDKAITSADGLAQLTVQPREPILGDWFKQGDLGFIYGARGLGKTWLALHITRQCAESGTVGDWKVHKPRRVLYVDGEMALDSIRERNAALSGTAVDGLYFLQHEALFHLTGKVLNLTAPAAQTALLDKCQRDKIEVLILDNLSCLFTGIKENDADAWELVLPWLLDLRRNRIAVVFVAHAGRNGFMRGTSRREDAAFWVLQLTEAKDAGEIQNGAKFVARFVKNRNATEAECPALEWHFNLPKGETRAHVAWKKLSTGQIFRQWIEDGVTSATDIAEEMGISKGQVSKLAKRGIIEGWLKKEGREYVLTGQG